ncbi:MAG: hypothetical protein PQJ59_18950 [Spirochaetales bacterium]|nr:hypothetical protein [Spirochaetales bacterium]
MKKIVTLMLLAAAALTFVGCGNSDETAAAIKADSLEINFAMGNNARTMTYQQATPLTLPSGKVIVQGDLKPTWQHISTELGVQMVDVTVQNQKASEMLDIASATGFNNAVVYGGNSQAEDLMNYGVQGYFVDLKQYLDKMPALKSYLEKNPNVAKAITAYDGGIYHVPYAAEINNYARVFCGRPDWVIALLDSDEMIEAESHTLNVAYEGYWDTRHSLNVVDLQNSAAAGGTLDAATARDVLLNYINKTYPKLDKPSDLYLGQYAQYDIDELVALWRVVELSPNTLSKVSTGAVVPDAEISPFFTRKSKNRENVFFLIPYFEGERVYGGDSDKARWVLDDKGDLVYSYSKVSFLERVNYLKQLYDEGLIYSEFYDRSVKDDVRKAMFFSDDIDGQRQFGFMTTDWIASTTKGSEKIMALLPPVTTIPQAGFNDFIHYMENGRAIKPDGWSISAAASEEKQNAAFALFNYMFTEEGNIVQNYSIPEILEQDKKFTGPDGLEYPMFNQWIFDTAGELKNGDVSGFLRDFMGSHLAIGYQKEIGFEYQYTTSNGFDSWALYNKGGVIIPTYEIDSEYLKLLPPVISLSEQNIAKLGTVSVGDTMVENLFMYISGLEAAGVEDATEFRAINEEAGLETYERVYQSAYDTMMGK